MRNTLTRAEQDYWAADEDLRHAHTQLATASDPVIRAHLLRAMHEATMTQAAVHRDAFGPDPDEDGMDQADSLAWESLLYALLADVEAAVTGPWHDQPDVFAGLDPDLLQRIRATGAGQILDRMATTTNLGERMLMLADLEAAVAPLVGAQAAEMLWNLPSPGHSGWMTLAEMQAHRLNQSAAHRTATVLSVLAGPVLLIGFVVGLGISAHGWWTDNVAGKMLGGLILGAASIGLLCRGRAASR